MTDTSTSQNEESMTARTSDWDARTTRAGSRSRGFAPNPVDHVHAEHAATRLVALREMERADSRAGLR